MVVFLCFVEFAFAFAFAFVFVVVVLLICCCCCCCCCCCRTSLWDHQLQRRPERSEYRGKRLATMSGDAGDERGLGLSEFHGNKAGGLRCGRLEFLKTPEKLGKWEVLRFMKVFGGWVKAMTLFENKFILFGLVRFTDGAEVHLLC